jgi:hypothetical protein
LIDRKALKNESQKLGAKNGMQQTQRGGKKKRLNEKYKSQCVKTEEIKHINK